MTLMMVARTAPDADDETRARLRQEAVAVLLDAHRRALLAYDRDMDNRGTASLIAARALLTVATRRDDHLIHEHIDAYADESTLLNTFLRALSSAAEESSSRAETAVRVWPSVVEHVILLHKTGRTPFADSHYGDYAVASWLPNPAGAVEYLYRELESDPIAWW
ncbi:MAG: hypothetical protein ACRDZX_12905 [Acidimicrobiales bacterium]